MQATYAFQAVEEFDLNAIEDGFGQFSQCTYYYPEENDYADYEAELGSAALVYGTYYSWLVPTVGDFVCFC